MKSPFSASFICTIQFSGKFLHYSLLSLHSFFSRDTLQKNKRKTLSNFVNFCKILKKTLAILNVTLEPSFFAHMTPIAICWSFQSFKIFRPYSWQYIIRQSFLYDNYLYRTRKRAPNESCDFIFIASLFIVWSVFLKNCSSLKSISSLSCHWFWCFTRFSLEIDPVIDASESTYDQIFFLRFHNW